MDIGHLSCLMKVHMVISFFGIGRQAVLHGSPASVPAILLLSTLRTKQAIQGICVGDENV